MSPASLKLDYLPLGELAARPASWWGGVLGVVGFEKPPAIEPDRVPVAASMTPVLGANETLCEVWHVGGSEQFEIVSATAKQSRVHYRYCDRLLFGSIAVEEQDLLKDGADSDSSALRAATMTAYREIFDVLNASEHKHLIRVWNYLPEINREADGDERYRHFNAARQLAFQKSGRATVGSAPAASALGSVAGSPVSIYFLAASRAPNMIENPRQTSAYRYPPQYGTHSPLFSRACVLSETTGTNLFVSGTASIVGHETIHRGDVAAQTREALNNIGALLGEANRVVAGSTSYRLDGLRYKVYVRRPADLPAIEREIASTLSPSLPIVYLQADVCREDLLVEIEAAGAATGSGAG